MVRFDDAWLRISEISHFRHDRGHSYHRLILTMADGAVYTHKDWQGSAYELEKRLIAAIEGTA